MSAIRPTSNATRAFDSVEPLLACDRRVGRLPSSRFAAPARLKIIAVLFAGLALGASTSLHADTYTYPGLGTFVAAGEVRKANSDDASEDFYGSDLKSMSHLVKSDLSPAKLGLPENSNGRSWTVLDSSKLTLAVSTNIRAYFVGEDTAYHNSLGFNTKGTGADPRDALVIFPDASTAVAWQNATNPKKNAKRTSRDPLFPGDFVDLGRMEKGTTLDFFLIANGRGPTLSGAPAVLRAKNLVAFTQVNNPYLLIGFEDGAESLDYSDTLFALDVGAANVNAMISEPTSGVPAPEPTLISLVVVCVGGVLQLLRRRRSRE
jgi:hypothetical protein